jgi:hypothetical protein
MPFGPCDYSTLIYMFSIFSHQRSSVSITTKNLDPELWAFVEAIAASVMQQLSREADGDFYA